MTLAQFVKDSGSQEKAARAIGVSFGTLNRWLNGHMRPSGKWTQHRFKVLGITTSA